MDKRSVTTSQLSDFKLFAQYAAAAYCDTSIDDIAVGTQLVCSGENCPLVEAANVTTTLEFSTTVSDTSGYLAVDTTNELIVLSIRGTETLRNYVSDLLFIRVDTAICDDCSAHSGFLESQLAIQSIVDAAIKSALTTYPTYRVVMTGHSLDAAVATLVGATLRNSGTPCDIITFGSPRVGDIDLANYITAQDGITARITHLDDPVPQIPPVEVFGYYHTSPEYWLSDGNATTVDYGVGDIVVCEGTDNTDCNAGTGILGFDTEAHMYYLDDTGACGTGFTF